MRSVATLDVGLQGFRVSGVWFGFEFQDFAWLLLASVL